MVSLGFIHRPPLESKPSLRRRVSDSSGRPHACVALGAAAAVLRGRADQTPARRVWGPRHLERHINYTVKTTGSFAVYFP